jgi:pimeloyl-ACP methyl ester carboxylesterase
MNLPSRPLDRPSPSAAALGALALAAVGSALWVERSSRRAEREHHAPHHLMYIDGTRLHYRLQGEGPPVLLVHGNLVDGADFEAAGLVEQLARRHQVLVIDRPGFGHSDRPRGTVWTPAAQARLLHRAAAYLELQRPVVVGHSMGAQVALAMALQDPASVAGLVLVGGYYWPSLRLDRWMVAPSAVPVLGDVLRYTSAAWTARATLGAALRGMFDPLPVPAHYLDVLHREMLLRPLQQRATAEDGSRMVAQARALAQQYAFLRTPVTLIAGADDRVVSPRQAERLHARLAHSHLHLLPGVGHMAHHAAPGLVCEAVDQVAAEGARAMARPKPAPAEGTAGPLPQSVSDLATLPATMG